MTDKERREWAYLRRFQKCFKGFPKGRIEKGKSPGPDFLVHTDVGVLGIEATRLRCTAPDGEGTFQEHDSLHGRILQKAEELYDNQYSLPVGACLHFNMNHRHRKRDVETVANQIIELVRRLMSVGEYGYIERNTSNMQWWPPAIEKVCLFRLPNERRSSWFQGNDPVPQNLTIKWIQANFDRKEPRCPRYREKCSELWLLIVAAGFLQSTAVDTPNETPQDRFHSSFDRAFLFDYPEKRHFELLIERKENHPAQG